MKPVRLRHVLARSWLISATFAGLAAIGVLFAVAINDWHHVRENESKNLAERTSVAARRVSAEILLRERGQTEQVVTLLREQLNLPSLTVVTETPTIQCSASEPCVSREFKSVTAVAKIPYVTPQQFVLAAQEIPSPFKFLTGQAVAIALTPLLLMLMAGIALQTKFLSRYVLQPIDELNRLATEKRSPPSNWPIELQTIARSLISTVRSQESEVFASLSRGVIHDLKTGLHSIGIAQDLVSAPGLTATQSSDRLAILSRTVATQIPKMKSLIELTLESSREVPLKPRIVPLGTTVDSAIAALGDFAKSAKVTITPSTEGKSIQVNHDPLQTERALVNLIKNALEAAAASKSGDPAQVRVSVVKSSTDSVTVYIDDSGTGLAIAKSSLYKPTRSTKSGGSGLGLYLANKLAVAQGAVLSYEKSPILSGSRFSLTFPLAQAIKGSFT